MNLETFLQLPTPEVATLVRQTGPKVCVFPINGTRRWFLLEHPDAMDEDYLATYMLVNEVRHVELYRMMFDHGIDYLVTPAFGLDITERSEAYISMAAQGLARLGTADVFLDFFREYEVRVHFYGDYRHYFDPEVIAIFDNLTARSRQYNRHRLFLGLFANDATDTVARFSVDYHAQHGRIPEKRAIIEYYYGEYVPSVSFFIGFDKFSVFDMPLIALGEEDLYFMVTPSPYLTVQQLREILFDHLYSRRTETDYLTLEPDEWNLMRDFYQANQGKTCGVGALQPRGGYWYPLPQVQLPPQFNEPNQ